MPSNILKNTAYTGWVIYDKKRDMTPSGYVPRPHGRQGYRKKVRRKPEEIIKVFLPLQPIISEEEFETVQQVLESRRRTIVAARRESEPQFAYNGYLFCGECDSSIYTKHSHQQLFYFCSSQHTRQRRRRELQGLSRCSNKYMLRDKIEPRIDAVLQQRLTDPSFLSPAISRYLEEQSQQSGLEANLDVVHGKMESLVRKRKRILESFFEGVISREKRNNALEKMQTEISALKRIQPLQKISNALSKEQIVDLVSVFKQWSFLDRNQKRQLLDQLVPEIFVYRYNVKGLTLRFGGDIDNPLPEAAEELRARDGGTRVIRPRTRLRCATGKLLQDVASSSHPPGRHC